MRTIKDKVKLALVVIFVFACSGITIGQNNLEKAQQMKTMYEFQKAIDLYNSYFESNAPKIDDARSLAECYMEINDTKLATEWMGKVVAFTEAKPADVKTYADLLKSEGKYKEAIAQYQTYKTLMPAEAEKADKWIISCENAIKWIEKPEYFDISNAKQFNTQYSEFGLVPFQKGYILTSDRKIDGRIYKPEELYGWTGSPYLKMFFVTVDKDNTVTDIKEMGDLNDIYHNGPGIFDPAAQTLHYTRTKMMRVPKKPINSDPTSWHDNSTAADYVNRLEMFSAKFNNNTWVEVLPFKYNDPAKFSMGHPAMSADGKILYFVSDMPGGFGGKDIYYCEKIDDNNWSTPKNCGNNINSDSNEVFPFIDTRGTLYFSSNGHSGMGGLDLFSATGMKDSWSVPENLKYPLNSPKDDFTIYFTQPGISGYLASNRDGGVGMDDIYSFAASPPKNLILSVITREKLDENTLRILPGVELAIKNIDNNEVRKIPVRSTGQIHTMIDCNARYEIVGTKEGYFTQAQTITTNCVSKHDTVVVELIFDKIVIDKPIVIKNIYYDFDKWNIRPDAAVELNKIVLILLQNPNIDIELGSHTDSRGSDSYNQILSQRRAESAVAYIIGNGIDQSRIKAKGYGESVPVNKCTNGAKCSEEEFQMNRRTEFKVTKINQGKTEEIKSLP